MVHQKKLHMKIRNMKLGPGGWHCPCCAPAKRERPAYVRAVKRGREKTWLRKLVSEQL